MAVTLNMDGNQIGNGAPGVAATDFVVFSQLGDLRQSILADAVTSAAVTSDADRSRSAEMLLVGLVARFGYRT